MRKLTVVLISIVLVVGFVSLVVYGFIHARGVPTDVAELVHTTLDVPFIDKEIDLASSASVAEEWNGISSIEIGLMYQVMVLPWGKSLVSPISVSAFHNKEDIYFHVSWKDDTGRGGKGISKFTDACAIMFPLDKEFRPSSIMMGFLGKTNIWQWKETQDREFWLNDVPERKVYVDFYYPFEEAETLVVSKDKPESAVNDLVAKMPGTITHKDAQVVQGRGSWDDGIWHVTFKRSLKSLAPESGAAFATADQRFVAFAVWNGANGDRGGRKSISDWLKLQIKS